MQNSYLVRDRYKPFIKNIENHQVSHLWLFEYNFSYFAEDICFSQNFCKSCWTSSRKYVIGDIVQLKTRFLCKSIEQSSSWDKTFNIENYNDKVYKILFWKFNFVKYNNKVINCYNILLFQVHSDASNTVIACVFDWRGKKNICYRNLTF